MNVKLRVFTHGLGVFVLSHMSMRIVYLHMKLRASTHKASCIYTAPFENIYVVTMAWGTISALNTDSNFI